MKNLLQFGICVSHHSLITAAGVIVLSGLTCFFLAGDDAHEVARRTLTGGSNTPSSSISLHKHRLSHLEEAKRLHDQYQHGISMKRMMHSFRHADHNTTARIDRIVSFCKHPLGTVLYLPRRSSFPTTQQFLVMCLERSHLISNTMSDEVGDEASRGDTRQWLTVYLVERKRGLSVKQKMRIEPLLRLPLLHSQPSDQMQSGLQSVCLTCDVESLDVSRCLIYVERLSHLVDTKSCDADVSVMVRHCQGEEAVSLQRVRVKNVLILSRVKSMVTLEMLSILSEDELRKSPHLFRVFTDVLERRIAVHHINGDKTLTDVVLEVVAAEAREDEDSMVTAVWLLVSAIHLDLSSSAVPVVLSRDEVQHLCIFLDDNVGRRQPLISNVPFPDVHESKGDSPSQFLLRWTHTDYNDTAEVVGIVGKNDQQQQPDRCSSTAVVLVALTCLGADSNSGFCSCLVSVASVQMPDTMEGVQQAPADGEEVSMITPLTMFQCDGKRLIATHRARLIAILSPSKHNVENTITHRQAPSLLISAIILAFPYAGAAASEGIKTVVSPFALRLIPSSSSGNVSRHPLSSVEWSTCIGSSSQFLQYASILSVFDVSGDNESLDRDSESSSLLDHATYVCAANPPRPSDKRFVGDDIADVVSFSVLPPHLITSLETMVIPLHRTILLSWLDASTFVFGVSLFEFGTCLAVCLVWWNFFSPPLLR